MAMLTALGTLVNNGTGRNTFYVAGAVPSWLALGLLITDSTQSIVPDGTFITGIDLVDDSGFTISCSAHFRGASAVNDTLTIYSVSQLPSIAPSVGVTGAQANAVWPDLASSQAFISPPRNGMDRSTGRLLQGWNHVEQSMEVIFETPFHERVLRRWVGSFVPAILGDNIVPRVIMRFFWAIASALDMREPDYRIKQVYFMGNALSGFSPATTDAVGLIRQGKVIFRQEGVYYPRGHLGNFTPFEQRQFGLVGRGGQFWDVVSPSGN